LDRGRAYENRLLRQRRRTLTNTFCALTPDDVSAASMPLPIWGRAVRRIRRAAAGRSMRKDPLMKYAFLIYDDEAQEDQSEEMMERWMAFTEETNQQGVLRRNRR